MNDTVLVSMGVLAFLVALNDSWLAYLKGWVTASVGGPGLSTLSNATSSVSTGAAASGGFGPSPQDIVPPSQQVASINGQTIGVSSLPTNIQ